MQIFVHSLDNIKCPTILKLLTCSVNTHVFNSLLFKSLKRFVFMILCPPHSKALRTAKVSKFLKLFLHSTNASIAQQLLQTTHSPIHPVTHLPSHAHPPSSIHAPAWALAKSRKHFHLICHSSCQYKTIYLFPSLPLFHSLTLSLSLGLLFLRFLLCSCSCSCSCSPGIFNYCRLAFVLGCCRKTNQKFNSSYFILPI